MSTVSRRKEETKDERGGRAFFDVGSVELGVQLVEKHGQGIEIGGKTLTPLH